MAFSMHRSWSTRLLFMQILLLSVGVLSTAVLLNHISLTAAIEFAANRVPSTMQRLCSWLRPPYLYLLVNGIIIFIAAFSRFRTSAEEPMTAATVMPGYEPPEIPPDELGGNIGSSQGWYEEEEIPMWTPPARTDTMECAPPPPALPADKHSGSSPRKALREGEDTTGNGTRGKQVTQPDTMDDTWEMIMADRGTPPQRHMLKCDTWQRHGPQINAKDAIVMKKWDTNTMIRERTEMENAPTTSAACRHWREPSLSQDELNRRVEAFIRKFNEEMRV